MIVWWSHAFRGRHAVWRSHPFRWGHAIWRSIAVGGRHVVSLGDGRVALGFVGHIRFLATCLGILTSVFGRHFAPAHTAARTHAARIAARPHVAHAARAARPHALGAAARAGIKAVVCGIHGYVAVQNVDVVCLNALVTRGNEQRAGLNRAGATRLDAMVALLRSHRDLQIAASDGNVGGCHDSLVGSRNGDIARLDVGVSALVVNGNAVVFGVYAQTCVGDPHTVVGVDGVFWCGNRNVSASNNKVVVGGNAMLVAGRHHKGAASVNGQVVVGKDRAVGAVGKGLLAVGITAGQRVR